jgi:phosphomevalonate kinase
LIRIKCDDQVRIDRGWKFEEGVDDIQSECDLDDFVEWDLVLENDGRRDVEEFLDEIIEKFLE